MTNFCQDNAWIEYIISVFKTYVGLEKYAGNLNYTQIIYTLKNIKNRLQPVQELRNLIIKWDNFNYSFGKLYPLSLTIC